MNSSSEKSHTQMNLADSLATAAEEMSQTLADIALNTERSFELSSDATEKAKEGDNNMIELIRQITQISDRVKHTSEQIILLSDQTQSISQIVNVIDGISEQTNLLALNAAIEAARAGEQGRGFAVVADEVRNLAQKTQGSTVEIQSLIQNLVEGASEARNRMNVVSADTSECVDIAQSAKGKFDALLRSIDELQQLNSTIATGTEQNAVVATEISRSTSNVRAATDESSVGINQATEISNDLHDTSYKITDIVKQFRVAA